MRRLRCLLPCLFALPLVVGLAVLCILPGTAWAREEAREGPEGVWPLAEPHPVVRGFEPPAPRWAPGHRGVDLLSREGAVVRAARSGTVSFAGLLAGKGVVAVAHADGTRTTYEPVLSIVARGDRVRVGEPIGRLVAGPGHCLPRVCLHWGWRRGEVYLDPLALVGAAAVRLLPVWGPPPPPGPAPAAGGGSTDEPTVEPTAEPTAGRLLTVASGGHWRWGAAGLGGLLAVGTAGALARSRRRRARSAPGECAGVIDLAGERARRRAVPPSITA